jgi:pimeloyl-ACP methyl ester carboxylesterase
MPVLAFGGEATFGPMVGAVIRCVADNVEDAVIPDCGHWITEEQPQATTDLVVDFLRRARAKAVPAVEADALSGVRCRGVAI